MVVGTDQMGWPRRDVGAVLASRAMAFDRPRPQHPRFKDAQGREVVIREPMTGRTFRIPHHLWVAAKAKADERGEYLSEVIRKALEKYVRRA